MIETWSPLTLFIFYTISSASTSVALLCTGDKPLTPRIVVGTAIFHGLVGGGIGMQLYEWKKVVWSSFMMAVGYGAGVIKIPQYKALLRNVLNDDNSKSS